MSAIRLALVNDHPLVVEGLRALLAGENDLRVVELDALTDVQEPVDIVLLDTFAQAEDVHDAVTRRLGEPTVRRVAVYSWNTDQSLVRDALAAGASAVISKSVGQADLVKGLHAVAAGQRLVLRGGGASTEDQRADQVRPGRDWPGREHGLSMREAEMISLISQGHSNEDICRMLYLSPNSVKSYIRSAYAKIGAQSRSQAVIWGIGHGMRPTPSRRRVPQS